MPVRHVQLAAWLDVPVAEDGVDLGRLKKALADRGVNARGWRLYLDYGDLLFDALGKPWVHPDWPLSSGPNAVTFLKLLAACEMDVPPPRGLVASMRDWKIPRERLELVPVHFFRALWKACVLAEYESPDNPELVSRFIRSAVVPLAEWFFSTGQHVDADANRLKAGWNALERDYLDWLKAQLRAQEERSPARPEWPVFITRVEYGNLRFVALASNAALMVEGEAMSHCIGDYGERCRAEMLRAFSVREKKTGQRVATLTVEELRPGGWNIENLKGFRNADVPPQVMQSALAVIQSLEDAYALQPRLRQEIDRTRSSLPADDSSCFDDIPF
jgi:hypothetical protein